MGFSRLPLFWRVFAINAALLVVATLLLALTPVTIHAPIALVEGLDLVVGLAVMLAANLILLRPAFVPLDRLVRRMRTVDLLRPGQRLAEGGGVEVTELVRTFNEMLDRLEAERRESGRRALAAQEAERLRIALGLHDEVGQVLTGVLLQLDSLAGAQPELEETKQAVRQALEEVRRIAQELRPEILDQLGLVSALTELSTRFARLSGKLVERSFTPDLPPLSSETELAIYRVATMQTLIEHQTIGYYLASLLLGICGGGSLFLATLGIYGLISLSVSQRTREIGVRLALGARQGRIVTTLLKRAVWQIAAGLAVGVLMAFALNQLLTHTVAGYPTVEHPALLFLAAIAFLGTISLIAILIPAVRGAKVHPMEALRYE